MSATSLAPAMQRPVNEPEPASARPSRVRNFDPLKPPTDKPQSYYDGIKQRFAEERDLRLSYRPEGRSQYTSDLAGALAKYEVDPFAEEIIEREPITDAVEVPVHRRRLLGAADGGAAARAGRREHPHRRARRRRRRHLVLEPLSGRGLRRALLRLPAAAGRDGLRALAPLRQGAGDLRPLPGDRRNATTSTTSPCSARRCLDHLERHRKLWLIEHRPGRQDAARVRDLRQRHALEAQTLEDRGHGDASPATPSTPRAGTTPTPAGPGEPLGQGRRHHRHRRLGGAGDPAPRQGGQGALRLPAHAVGHRHPRRPADRSGMGRPG